MFRHPSRKTVIAEGLKIDGNVTAEGFVKVHGEIEGDLHCTSLVISEKANITGTVIADTVIVNGTVYGSISGAHITLKPQAKVTGDIHHQSLTVEKGAFFDGRSHRTDTPVKAKAEQSSPPKKPAASKRTASGK